MNIRIKYSAYRDHMWVVVDTTSDQILGQFQDKTAAKEYAKSRGML